LAGLPADKKAKHWPEGYRIYSLVHAIYDKYVRKPEEWLALWVAKEAADQGWRQISDEGIWPWEVERFEPAPDHAAQLQQEAEITRTLSDRLAQVHPGLSYALDAEIKKGIESRESQGASGGANP
jgi:hypothetical protein